jgi:hypothetical protein
LQYIQHYYAHPERFAKHYVKCIQGNLDVSSSQGAESNHSSVVAHGEEGSNQDMAKQIHNLMGRQKHREEMYAKDDANHMIDSGARAFHDDQNGNHVQAEARRVLSKFSYDEYWIPVLLDADNYTMLPDEGDNHHRILRNGCPLTSACLVPKDGRCGCDQYLKFLSMCPHEYIVHCQEAATKVFPASLYPERLKQTHRMLPIAESGNEGDDDGDSMVMVAEDEDSMTQQEPMIEEDDEDDSPMDSIDDTMAGQLGPMVGDSALAGSLVSSEGCPC